MRANDLKKIDCWWNRGSKVLWERNIQVDGCHETQKSKRVSKLTFNKVLFHHIKDNPDCQKSLGSLMSEPRKSPQRSFFSVPRYRFALALPSKRKAKTMPASASQGSDISKPRSAVNTRAIRSYRTVRSGGGIRIQLSSILLLNANSPFIRMFRYKIPLSLTDRKRPRMRSFYWKL